jgi:hypothetical protein
MGNGNNIPFDNKGAGNENQVNGDNRDNKRGGMYIGGKV